MTSDGRSVSDAEVRSAWENFVAVGESGDWDAWADLHTVDGVWVEHHLGTFHGRESIRAAINSVMALAPPTMTFPVEWVVFDGRRVVYYPWQVLPHPTGGEDLRFGCVTILEYAGDGQFSYQEDLYNPAEGEKVFGEWIAAGGVLPTTP